MADKRKKFEDSFDDNEFLSNLRKTDPARPPKKGSPEYIQDVQQVHGVQVGANLPKYEDLSTQGRKGFSVNRINMGFSPENHAFIKRAAQKEGRTITAFVNDLINQYRCDPHIQIQEVQEDEKIKPISSKARINMGFTEDTYRYLKTESRKKGRSITDFVNCILSEYRNVSE